MDGYTTKQSSEGVLKRVSLGTGVGAIIGLFVGLSAMVLCKHVFWPDAPMKLRVAYSLHTLLGLFVGLFTGFFSTACGIALQQWQTRRQITFGIRVILYLMAVLIGVFIIINTPTCRLHGGSLDSVELSSVIVVCLTTGVTVVAGSMIGYRHIDT